MAFSGKMGKMDIYEDQKDESSRIEQKSLENMGFCGGNEQKKEIGLAGFEPTTSCTPSKRASQAALQPEQS